MSSFSFVLLIFLLPANLQQKNKSGGSTKSYRITLYTGWKPKGAKVMVGLLGVEQRTKVIMLYC